MTTLIIDRKLGLVVSDSRGTQENEISSWKFLPFPHIEKTTTKDYLTVQKIYEFNNHVIVGCGSLALLEMFAYQIKLFNFHFDKVYYRRFEYDLDRTTVYINKRTLGKVYTLSLSIEPVKLGFGWYKLKVTKNTHDKRYTFNGSGRQYALGAREDGKTLQECVKITAKYDVYTDDDIQEVWL